MPAPSLLPFFLPLSFSAPLPLVRPYGVVALALVPARSESNASIGQHDDARLYGGPNAAGDCWEAIDQVHALQLDAGRQEERTMHAAMRPISFDMSENGRQVIRVCVIVCVCARARACACACVFVCLCVCVCVCVN